MPRVRASWVARNAGRELDAYLRQRAWHWACTENFALSTDYLIRLLNRHPRDPLGLVLGEAVGARAGQSEFATKCAEATQRLCFIKGCENPPLDLIDAAALKGLRVATSSAARVSAGPSAADVAQLLEGLASSHAVAGDEPVTADAEGDDETLLVRDSEPLDETSARVVRSCRSCSPAAPLVELLEPRDTTYGRGLYATRRIATRTGILADSPYLVQRYDESHCAQCLKPIAPLDGEGGSSSSGSHATVRCPSCADESYCSRACQEIAWKEYHACCCRAVNPEFAVLEDAMKETLYGASSKDSSSGCSSDPGSEARAALSCLAVSKVCAMATMQQCHPLSLPGVRGLRGSADYQRRTALAEIGALAIALSSALRQPQLFMEEVLSLFALLQTNEFIAEGGVALYPTLSLLNHSCEPNCAVVKDRAAPRRVLVALKDIRDGEQLLIDYNSSLTTKLSYEQRKALCAQRHFECFCPACVRRK